uniref:bifunctional diguanylate cyclase/phosphodiesterase n=1 Tax=Pseudoalteromonas sp. TaxID=53249 RepID=UPI003568793F
ELLDTILVNGTITTLFQPLFDTSNQTILGYEALSRGPKNSALEMPNALFQAAHQHGLLSELELLCRSKAIENFVHLQLQGKLFLNVSPKTLLDPSHPKGETLHLIKQFGLAANRVVIEVTEQERVEDEFLLQKTLEHYRSLGFTIAIDDLGAGYSGLKQWSELCPDFVKVDRYFIDHCDKSAVKKQFLTLIIALAKATNTAVIAEGIERTAELSVLAELGIKYVQGFLLERPNKQPSYAATARQVQALSCATNSSKLNNSMAIGWLAIAQPAIDSGTSCKDAHALFEQDKSMVSLAVVNSQYQPVGLLHKEQLSDVFAAAYGHALYDKRAVTVIMDEHPLVVDENQLLDHVSQQITGDDFDIRRHIVITRGQQYLGLVPLRNILKHITDEKIRHAQHANPLTMLPGNVAINDAIEQRLAAQQAFSIAYLDLNHFKQFNDLFGYASGDSVIKLLAAITQKACNNTRSFVGHIGGDDFMVLFDEHDAVTVCEHIIHQFELQSQQYFSREEINNNGYWATNRAGQQQFVPLLTLAIGLVTPDLGRCKSSHQVAALASDAKQSAKRCAHSYLFVCQRSKPLNAAMRLVQHAV